MYRFDKKHLLLLLLLSSFSVKTMGKKLIYLKLLSESLIDSFCGEACCMESPQKHLEAVQRNNDTDLPVLTSHRNIDGDTVLHLACREGDIDSIMKICHAEAEQESSYLSEMLLKTGVTRDYFKDIFGCNLNGLSPLHIASAYGHADVIDTLLSIYRQSGKDPWQFISNKNYQNGYTALHCAAEEGHIDAAQALINASGDQALELIEHVCSEEYSYTALDLAVIRGHADIVRLLLKTVGDNASQLVSEYYDTQGLTTISLAIYHGHIDVISTLIEIIGNDVLDDLTIEKDDRGRVYLRTEKNTLLHLAETKLAALKEAYLQNQSEVDCTICGETKSGADFHIMECCNIDQINSGNGCIFCKECLTNYTTYCVKDEKSTLELKCPNRECLKRMEYLDIYKLTKDEYPELYEAYCDVTFNENLNTDQTIKRCRTPDCHHVFENKDNIKKDYQCPECKIIFCSACLFKHKVHITCSQAARDRRETEDQASLKWITKNTKTCPQCKVSVQKNKGCNHMTCNSCRYEFCWYCKAKYRTTACHSSFCERKKKETGNGHIPWS